MAQKQKPKAEQRTRWLPHTRLTEAESLRFFADAIRRGYNKKWSQYIRHMLFKEPPAEQPTGMPYPDMLANLRDLAEVMPKVSDRPSVAEKLKAISTRHHKALGHDPQSHHKG